ncbi:MAG: helix-turn-helix transcriptional regulator [Desulfitobacterium sp.]
MSQNNNKTLLDVIKECSQKLYTRKEQNDQEKALSAFFENYYGGKDNPTVRLNILHTSIGEYLEMLEDFTANIYDGVKSYPNAKHTLVAHLNHLLQHLKGRYSISYEVSFLSNFNYREKSERLLKMLKYLHSGERKRSQIADEFGISERALADDLKTLQEGYEFMDTTMQISELKRGSNTYQSLIHPTFLALNTSEIYALTVGLKLLSKDTVLEDTLDTLANKIYKQLSSTAKEIVDQQADELSLSFEEEELKFTNTYDLMKRRNTPFAYFLKEELPCRVMYLKDGKMHSIVGKP